MSGSGGTAAPAARAPRIVTIVLVIIVIIVIVIIVIVTVIIIIVTVIIIVGCAYLSAQGGGAGHDGFGVLVSTTLPSFQNHTLAHDLPQPSWVE